MTYSTPEIERIQRTQVFRCLQLKNPQELYDAVVAAYPDLANSVDSVRRDEMDKRRYYVTYKTLESKRTANSRGFTHGKTIIPAMDGDVMGFVPFVPPALDADGIKTL